MLFIGDVHGDYESYLAVLGDAEESVQVGDFGMGFYTDEEEDALRKFQVSGRHRFIRGNHDDPARCRKMPGWIEDGTYDAEHQIMYIGGASSGNPSAKVAGFDWWPDEQLSNYALGMIADDFERYRPEIVVSHDAPHSALLHLFGSRTHKPIVNTQTASALQTMFEAHKPRLWLFGHWHLSRREIFEGTEFICLDINEAREVSL